MRVLRGLPLLLVLVLAAAGARAALTLQAQPLWHGALKAGHSTELSISLDSDRNGRVEIRIPDHRPALLVETEVQAYRPITLPLAVHPDAAASLRIEAGMADAGTASTEVILSVLSPATRLQVSTLALSLDPVPGQRLQTVTPDRLPRTAAGYDTIDALVLDETAYLALDEAQRLQLLDYSARCGNLLAVGTASDWYAPLQRIAGCDGHGVTVVPTAQAATARLQQPLPALQTPLPDARQLQQLLTQQAHDTWLRLLLFFSLYALALLLFARGYVRALSVPAVAGLVAWLAWSGDASQRQLASWSEIRSGDHSLRYSALLELTGEGRGRSETSLPTDLGLLQAIGTEAGAQLQLSRIENRTTLMNQQALLARQGFQARGSLPAAAPLHLTQQGPHPVVSNPGTGISPPALLGWNGHRHTVPSLRPGEHWSPSPDDDSAWQVSRIEEQLLRRRTQDQAALLLPHRLLPEDTDSGIEETGWLLITRS